MTKQQILQDIQTIIEDRIGLDPQDVKMESNFTNDLGFDSLDSIEVLMDIEIKYKILIPDLELEKVNTVSEIVDLVYSKINN